MNESAGFDVSLSTLVDCVCVCVCLEEVWFFNFRRDAALGCSGAAPRHLKHNVADIYIFFLKKEEVSHQFWHNFLKLEKAMKSLSSETSCRSVRLARWICIIKRQEGESISVRRVLTKPSWIMISLKTPRLVCSNSFFLFVTMNKRDPLQVTVICVLPWAWVTGAAADALWGDNSGNNRSSLAPPFIKLDGTFKFKPNSLWVTVALFTYFFSLCHKVYSTQFKQE